MLMGFTSLVALSSAPRIEKPKHILGNNHKAAGDAQRFPNGQHKKIFKKKNQENEGSK